MPIKIPPFTPVPIQPTSAEPFSTFVQQTPLATTPLTGTELVPIVQGGNSRHTPANVIAPPFPAHRTILTANTNYYVATPLNGGSDSNDGSLAHPWATLQHAMDFISATLDIAGFTITVSIGTGTFAGLGLKSTVGGGFIQFIGNGSVNTKITAGPNDGVFNFGECVGNYPSNSGTEIGMDSVTWLPTILSAYGQGNNLVFQVGTIAGFVTNDVTIDLTNWVAGTVPIFNNDGGPLSPALGSGTLTIKGANQTVDSVFQSRFFPVVTDVFGASIVVTGNLTTVTGFVVCLEGGVYQNFGSTITGAGVTGPRFSVLTDSSIQSQFEGQLGPNFFPGNSPGICDASSDYDGLPGPIPNPNKQTGSSYTMAATDLFARVEMTNAGANTFTVPTEASMGVSLTRGQVTVTQGGAGATTIAGAGGVTVHNAGAVGGQWKTALLYWRATNEWVQTSA